MPTDLSYIHCWTLINGPGAVVVGKGTPGPRLGPRRRRPSQHSWQRQASARRRRRRRDFARNVLEPNGVAGRQGQLAAGVAPHQRQRRRDRGRRDRRNRTKNRGALPSSAAAARCRRARWRTPEAAARAAPAARPARPRRPGWAAQGLGLVAGRRAAAAASGERGPWLRRPAPLPAPRQGPGEQASNLPMAESWWDRAARPAGRPREAAAAPKERRSRGRALRPGLAQALARRTVRLARARGVGLEQQAVAVAAGVEAAEA